MEDKDLEQRFGTPPTTFELQNISLGNVAEAFLQLATLLDYACEDGREKSLAFTKLEEAMFWCRASIERQAGADD